MYLRVFRKQYKSICANSQRCPINRGSSIVDITREGHNTFSSKLHSSLRSQTARIVDVPCDNSSEKVLEVYSFRHANHCRKSLFWQIINRNCGHLVHFGIKNFSKVFLTFTVRPHKHTWLYLLLSEDGYFYIRVHVLAQRRFWVANVSTWLTKKPITQSFKLSHRFFWFPLVTWGTMSEDETSLRAAPKLWLIDSCIQEIYEALRADIG